MSIFYRSRVGQSGVALATVLALFGFLFVAAPAQATQSPANCTSNDFVLNIAKSISLAYDETSPFGATTVTYSVSTGNPDSGTTCDVDNVDVNLTTPDGVIHNLETGGSYLAGTATALLGTVNYDVDSADITGGVVVASVNATGDLHDNNTVDSTLDITKNIGLPVIHPSTITTITSSATEVQAGATVTLTITEENDGDTPLATTTVEVDNGVGTLSAPPNAGDDGDGILEPGETWSWTVSGVVINADTTFIATGHGLDSLGNDLTWCEDSQNPAEGVTCDQDEQDSVTITTVDPSTAVSATVDIDLILSGDTVELTITETNDGDVDLANAYVDLQPLGMTLDETSLGFSSDGNNDSTLAAGETWTWVITDNPLGDITYIATGHGTDSLGNDVTWCEDPQTPGEGVICDQDEQASVSVGIVSPSTIVGITASETTVIAGATVTLTITEENDGDADLTDAYVEVDNGVGILDDASANFSGDDGDGILEPGETWSWDVDVIVNVDTIFTATGHGLDPLGNDVTYPADPEEQDIVEITVEVLTGCTLTQGYWKTHSELGPAPYDDTWALLAAGASTILPGSSQTWYEVFQTPPKGGNVWYQLAHQWMAAYLNSLTGAAMPADVASALTDAEAWLAAHSPAENLKAKNAPEAAAWASLLGSYNEGEVGPGHCEDETLI